MAGERVTAKDSIEMWEQMCRGAGCEILAKHLQMILRGQSMQEFGTCRIGSSLRTSLPNASVMLRVTSLLLLAAALYGQQQPVPYSHKAHLALGLKCNSCHKKF